MTIISGQGRYYEVLKEYDAFNAGLANRLFKGGQGWTNYGLARKLLHVCIVIPLEGGRAHRLGDMARALATEPRANEYVDRVGQRSPLKSMKPLG